MLQEIKTLVQTLNEQRDAYYNKDSPKMTDKEYDRLFDRLEELEKKSGIIFSNSPTQSVGYYPVSELAKVRHTRALLSLEKTKQIRELADFMENQDTLLMLKLDGLTVKQENYNDYELSVIDEYETKFKRNASYYLSIFLLDIWDSNTRNEFLGYSSEWGDMTTNLSSPYDACITVIF